MKAKGMKTLVICTTLNVATTALCSFSIPGYSLGELREANLQLRAEGLGDFNMATENVVIFAQVHCMNLATERKDEQRALEWPRKYVALYPPQETETYGSDAKRDSIEAKRKRIFAYLAVKGDASDIEVVKQFNSDILGALLEQRVAGVNIFDYDADKLKPAHFLWRPKTFFPSVANAGPQAVYVRELLYRFWEEIGRDSSKIPQELLTMVVSFDENKNPVCSVDLAKYGLSMPVITPKPDMRNFTFLDEGLSHEISGKFTVKFPDLAEAVEITNDMDRHSPDWKGLYKPRPTQPPPPTENGRGVLHTPPEPKPPTNVVTNAASQKTNPVEPNPTPWKLPLLIGILILGGGVVAWRFCKRR